MGQHHPSVLNLDRSGDLDLCRDHPDVSVGVKTLLRRSLDGPGSSLAAVPDPVLGSGCCVPPHQKEPSRSLLKKAVAKACCVILGCDV